MTDLPPANLRGAVDLSGLVRRAAEPARGPRPEGAAPAASSLVFESSDATFESVLELSTRVPVVVEIIAPGLSSALGPIVESYGGRLVLAVVDGSVSPQIAQAFQVREVPAVAAVVAGRPVNLFIGIPSEQEVRQVFDELLQLAAQNGVNGTVPAGGGGEGETAEPEPEPLPPLHQEAYDAIERDDLPAAAAAYEKALKENPRDADAKAGLAQVRLLERLRGADPQAVRRAAADDPEDLEAQLAVADLDVATGAVEDGFARLIDLVRVRFGEDREKLRERLLDLFEVVGGEDERVVVARRALASALY